MVDDSDRSEHNAGGRDYIFYVISQQYFYLVNMRYEVEYSEYLTMAMWF